MAEDTQPMTLQERIASLNAAHIARAPTDVTLPNGRPRPPVVASKPVIRQQSFNLPNEKVTSTTPTPSRANMPNGPPLLLSRKPPPLPVRTDTLEKKSAVVPRLSNESTGPRVMAVRTKSDEDKGRIKAPAWGEVELPPLPSRMETKQRTKSTSDRPQYVSRAPSSTSIASTATTSSNGSRVTIPPPPLPHRKSSSELRVTANRKMPPLPDPAILEKARKSSFNPIDDAAVQETVTPPLLPTRRPSVPLTQNVEPPVPVNHLQKQPLANNVQAKSPVSNAQPQSLVNTMQTSKDPPPIPKASRPDLSAIQATKPKMDGHQRPSSIPTNSCMICRDFSAPDYHATLFPRQRVNSLQDLAQQLTAPFPSHTDKARAIFTWLHHNVDYNVRDFFSKNLKPSTPQSTLQTGLAVCEGYAALFTNLATYAGLESVVVSGHGKGFGFNALTRGSPLPPYDGNHAWNAVKIDNGEWKLIDSCWGAGHVQGAGMPYCRKFAPERFTQTNEEFGIDHFPNNKNQFFLPGGHTFTWEEYIQINPALWPYDFERPTFFDNAKTDYSIGKNTVSPANRKISVHQPGTVRFSFGLFCPHWTLEKHSQNGLPPVFILATGGIDGRNKEFVPLEHVKSNPQSTGGDMWYVDVPARQLGAPGETLTLFAVTTFGQRQNARGLTVKEFKDGVGRTAMGFVGVSAWDLV